MLFPMTCTELVEVAMSNCKSPEKEIGFKHSNIAIWAPIIKLSRTLQGIWTTKHFEQQKTEGKWQFVARSVTYYEFIAVMDTKRVKVTVKEVEGGEKHFWSIIPNWGIDKNCSRVSGWM